MSAIRDHYRKHAKSRAFKDGYHVIPEVTCNDGFAMSVQASGFHYCSPRVTDPEGNYDSWEVGFPSKKEKALMPYAEDADTPTDTVYNRVPTKIVDAIIERHGGIGPAKSKGE